MSTAYTANLLGALAVGVFDRITARLESRAGAGGMVPAALFSIGTYAGQSIDDLRRILGLTHSGTVRLVDRLCSDGLVERREGPNRRTVSLFLSGEGRVLFQELLKDRQLVLDELLSVLTPVEERGLEEVLEKLLLSIPENRVEARHLCRLCDQSVCPDEVCPPGRAVSETFRE